MDAPLDSWEQWRRGTPASGFDPSTRSFSNNISDYGQTMNARYTDGHATSSLARVKAEDIERSTKIVSVEAASHLAGYEDPIKLILPPVLQEANVVYVKRKYAVGNTATEVPERAPAPVVSVQEETRRVTLRRYGGDIDFNVNACAVPDMFKREMDLKVGAQHAALADRLVALGYETLIREGTDFTSALVRSGAGLDVDIQARAQRFYFQQVFGALSTSPYPIHNLLAAAKRCTAYDISKSLKSVLILPHGVPEMMAYARAENMRYEINGIAGPQGKPITMQVENGYKIPATTASVFVHIPPALHLHGSAAPVAGQNALEEVVQVYHTYKLPDGAVTPFNNVTGTDWDFKQDLNNDVLYYVDIIDRTHRCIGDRAAGLLYSFDESTKYVDKGMGTIVHAQLQDFSDESDPAKREKKSGNLRLPNMSRQNNLQKIVATELNTMHAILATPGEETGNLLMQYPRSTVSADASTESGRMQLRVYMGAVLKRPENVLVMRNVAFNGVRDQRMMGCVKDDTRGVVPGRFDDDDFMNLGIYNTIATQPSLFASANTMRKYANRNFTAQLEDQPISFAEFLDQLTLDTSGNCDIIKSLTKLQYNNAGDINLGNSELYGQRESRFSAKRSDLWKSSLFDGLVFPDLTFSSDSNVINLLPQPGAAGVVNLKFNQTGPNRKAVAMFDVTSGILRLIMLNSSDVALEDQRKLDHELNIDGALTELYCSKVEGMRDTIIKKIQEGKLSRISGSFVGSRGNTTLQVAPFSKKGQNANEYGIDYWDSVCKGDPIIEDYKLNPLLSGNNLSVEQMEHESANHWLSYLSSEKITQHVSYPDMQPHLQSRASLNAAVVKEGDLKETIFPGINCIETDNGGLWDQKKTATATAIQASIETVKTGWNGQRMVEHMNDLILNGLEWADECAELLYLFCLITDQRNKAMAREQYRFGEGSHYKIKPGTNPLSGRSSLVELGEIVSDFPAPSRPTTSEEMNIQTENKGQFKGLDDIKSVDKFCGMSIQRYSDNLPSLSGN
jgi:hypothetical protein